MLSASAGIVQRSWQHVQLLQYQGSCKEHLPLHACLGRHHCGAWRWFQANSIGQFGPGKRDSCGRRLVLSIRADHKGVNPKPSQEARSRVGTGYHPLEDVPTHENRREGEARLMPPEIARTIAEMNHAGLIFASVVSDANTVIGTDLNYVVDEHGDFYFELNSDDEWIGNLEREQTFTVLIGYGGMEDISLAEIEEVDEKDGKGDGLNSESSYSDGDDDGPLETSEEPQYWGGGVEAYFNRTTPEIMGSLGAWGGFETLHWVHPMDFADKLATVALMDYAGEIDVVTRRLCLVGTVRRVSPVEEDHVRDLFEYRFTDLEDSDDDEEGGTADEAEESDEGEGLGSRRWKKALLEAVRQEAREAEEGQQAATSVSHEDGNIYPTSRSSSSSDPDRADQHSGLGEHSGGREDARDNAAESSGWIRRELGEVGRALDEAIGVSWVVVNEDGSDDLTAAELGGLKDQLGAFLGGEFVDGVWGDERSGHGWVLRGPELDVTDRNPAGEGTSFFKLEIAKVLLDTNSGIQTEVDHLEFAAARPDILAHSAEAMIERINNGGRKVLGSLINIVRREKGLEPEEANVVGIDHLGIDLRVRCGIELSTVRLAFRRPATCEEHAEQLLKELFNPRKSKRGTGPGHWQFKRKSKKK